MEGMRDSLMCPIHLDLLENAKTLPCQHVVCEECIALWVAKKGHLLCPTCKKGHNLPAGGVEYLPTNFMINGLVEEFKKVGKGGKMGDRRRRSSSEDSRGEKSSQSSAPKRRVDFKTSFIEKKSKSYEDVCGSSIALNVQLCDSQRKPVRANESDRINASVVTPKGKKVWASVRKEGGLFVITFSPKMCGVHRVEALLGKQNIKGSPLMIVVRPKGRFLSAIGGVLECPVDVVSIGYSLYVTDAKSGSFLCADWLGREKIQVQPPKGKNPDEVRPFGIAHSEEGDKVYITDNANGCCYLYKNGVSISTFGKKVLKQPTGIVVDKNSSVFVADRASTEIAMFSSNFSHMENLNVYGLGKKADSKPFVTCLALNQAEDKLIVADEANCCLKVITINDDRGVHTITTKVGQAPAHPFGVAVDKDDNIYVTVRYQSSDQTGKRGDSKAPKPKPLMAGGSGEQKGAVLMYNNEGYFLGRFGDGELLKPGGICVIEEPSLTAIVVEMGGTGYGSKAPGLKIFSI